MKKQLESFVPEVIKTPMRKRPPKRVPIPDDYDIQCRLGDELIVWSEDEDIFCIEDFPLSKSMSPNRFYKIGDNNEYFSDCLDTAMQTIGSRLQRAWRNKTLDREYVVRILPIYNSQFRDLSLAKLKITEEARQQGNVFHVTIPPIPAIKPSEETK